MENRKQLIIIPPMSEPLQKLKEVLEGIANDENIEISIIDDLKELMQFVGSSGQCLIAFANAKKCATFLQENRFLIAKTHTKVILLTPKEIPAKTLIKFTKIGLTESILENSPPKTLLYKVKLLLRSIKTSGGSEDKELAVKSIEASGAKEAAAKGEINTDKLQSEEGSVNFLAEERAKFKKGEGEVESVNYMENLKGKKTTQEEAIETHWKSKRKKDESLTSEEESDHSKVKTEDPSKIDMYYRGKKKNNEVDIYAEDDFKPRKRHDQPEEEEALLEQKSSLDLDLAPGDIEKRKKLQQEEELDYDFKQSSKPFALEEAEEEKRRPVMNEEEEEERKRQELNELEALFEEAKKRQAQKEVEDLGGHYKGKISNTTMDFDEQEETQEREDYDNSDLYSREKPLDFNLEPVEEERRKHRQEEEEQEEKERQAVSESLGGNLESEEGQTDHIETLMKGGAGVDRTKNIKTHDIQERERTKAQEEELAEEGAKLDLDLDPASPEYAKAKKTEEEQGLDEDQSSTDLDLSPASIEEREKKKSLQEEKEIQERAAQSKLQLVDGDEAQRSSSTDAEEEDSVKLKKLDKVKASTDSDRERSSEGKTDKIDTYYRSGQAKKKDHDWDLDEKKNNLDLGLEKKAKRGPDGTQKKESVDLGEQTIDYRKIKEEFEAISRGEDPSDEAFSGSGARGRSSQDLEDDSFKVIEVEPAGFDFAIEVLNLIYQKDIKADEFYKNISEEMQKTYKAFPVFYSFKPSDKKHTEVFDSILKLSTDDHLRQWWMDHKKEEKLWEEAQSKTMPTWVCREMNWEDVELPTWASNELTTKKVEWIYPYYDGVDRMGLAVVYFPEGINPKQAKGIEVTLELARTLLLDSIQRKTADNRRDDDQALEEPTGEKKTILNVFSGLFKGKKAG